MTAIVEVNERGRKIEIKKRMRVARSGGIGVYCFNVNLKVVIREAACIISSKVKVMKSLHASLSN
jgi:hypothetical protein